MSLVQKIISELDVEQLDTLLFRGKPNAWKSGHVFGGHVVAQAMKAARKTVADKYRLHSVHCYFLRPGKAGQDIIYDVEAIRDGASFCTRRVVAIQNGEAIFSVAYSYHREEQGLAHQIDMPDVPTPEDLDDDENYYISFLKSIKRDPDSLPLMPFEMRTVDRLDLRSPASKNPIGGYWMRLKEPLSDEQEQDRSLHALLLAYQSDYAFLSSTLRPHGMIAGSPGLKIVASLDHTMWYHNHTYRIDEWIFYKTEGYWSGEGRGLARGAIYSRDGLLIASTAQECLLRLQSRKSE